MEENNKNKVITLSKDNLQILKKSLFHYASFLHSLDNNQPYIVKSKNVEKLYKKCLECNSNIKKQESNENLVYIISSCGDGWSEKRKITYVTTSREKAKEKLREIILDPWTPVPEEALPFVFYDKKEQEEFYARFNDGEKKPSKKRIEEFVKDMTSNNPNDSSNHCANEFPYIRVWCEVKELM